MFRKGGPFGSTFNGDTRYMTAENGVAGAPGGDRAGPAQAMTISATGRGQPRVATGVRLAGGHRTNVTGRSGR